MTHFHLKTDYMQGLGTFAGGREAQEHAERFERVNGGGRGGYTAKQMAGRTRAYECECWMGEGNLKFEREQAARDRARIQARIDAIARA